LFAPGFFLELFAIFVLVNRGVALVFGAALVLMHVGIGTIMRLYFPEFEALVLIFCVNVPFLIASLIGRSRTAVQRYA
jgi:hypothetical protein